MPKLKVRYGPLLGVLAYIGMLILDQVLISREPYQWPELLSHFVVLISFIFLTVRTTPPAADLPLSFDKVKMAYYFGALFLFALALSELSFSQSLTRDDLVQIELSQNFHSYSACGFQSQPYLSCFLTRTISALAQPTDLIFKLVSAFWIFLSFIVFNQILKIVQFSKPVIAFGGFVFLFNPVLLNYALQIRPIALSVFLSLLFLYQLLNVLKSGLTNRIFSDVSVKFFLISFLFVNSVGFQSVAFVICALIAGFLHVSEKSFKEKFNNLCPPIFAFILFIPIQAHIISEFSPAAGALTSRSGLAFDRIWPFLINLTQMWNQSFGPLTVGLFVLSLVGFIKLQPWPRFFVRTAIFYYSLTLIMFSQLIALPFQAKYNLTIWSILLLVMLFLVQKVERQTLKILFFIILGGQSLFLYYKTPAIQNYSYKDQAGWIQSNAKSGDYVLSACLPYEYNFCFSRIENFKGQFAYKISNGTDFQLSSLNFTPATVEFVKTQKNYQRLVLIVERPAGRQHPSSVLQDFIEAGFEVHPAGSEIILTLSPPYAEKLQHLSLLLHQAERNIKSEALYEWRLTLDLITQNYSQYVIDTLEYLDSQTSKQAHLFVDQQVENEKYFFNEKVFRNE